VHIRSVRVHHGSVRVQPSSVGFSVQQLRRVQCSTVRAQGGKVRVQSNFQECSEAYLGAAQLSKVQHSSVRVQCSFKGTESRDFLLLVFFINQFPPSP
jgi:hypothetical protein